MPILDKKEIVNKLNSLSERIDSTLIHNHLELSDKDVKFLRDLANKIDNNLFPIYVKGVY